MTRLRLITGILMYVALFGTAVAVSLWRHPCWTSLNMYDATPMTQEEIDWFNGAMKPAPGVFPAHPLSEYR